ncbi:hypothetical protein BH09BAC3_BH09BAC3_38230 [soil metagenome]
MKLTTFLVLITTGCCFAQDNEFKIHSNGLIYDSSTMKTLGHIVDSLNVKFRTCDPSHPYLSYEQGFAHYVVAPSKAVRKLIHDGISFEDYARKYPRSIKRRNVWIKKSHYINYENENFVEYASLPGKDELSIDLKNRKANDKTTGWILQDDDEGAFYLTGLSAQKLPPDLARLVQYVDCMVDTTAQVFFPDAKGAVYQRVNENTKAKQFIEWAESFPDEPSYPDYNKIENFDSAFNIFQPKYEAWDSLRMRHLDSQMQTSQYWKSLLMDARDEAFENSNSDARLEMYVGRYLSDADALRLMRGRRVIGNCSQDQSPRYHAMNICRLAAETAQWDIFLRSHLDIMNDRFERQSDGSYAWAGRKTYLKELEELDIDAIDLLLGTTLRVQNVSKNHYNGYINRTGRALADADDKDALELRMISMIQNDKLDPYNRVLIVYLFKNYVYNLDDEKRKAACTATLREVVKELPENVFDVGL